MSLTIPAGRTEIVTLPDPKDPADRLRYRMDWSAFLQSVSDSINQSTWRADGLTVSGPAIDPNAPMTTLVWLEGGDPGQTYTVSNRITTGAGRVVERSFRVMVAER